MPTTSEGTRPNVVFSWWLAYFTDEPTAAEIAAAIEDGRWLVVPAGGLERYPLVAPPPQARELHCKSRTGRAKAMSFDAVQSEPPRAASRSRRSSIG